MERKLINYLPYVVRDYDVFRTMMEAEQPEFETAWASVHDLMDNQFIATAGNVGLCRWEKILEITPKGTDTLAERKARVKAQWNLELPYTLPWLRRWLAEVCGGTAEVQDYTLRLALPVGEGREPRWLLETARRAVEAAKPANLLAVYTAAFPPCAFHTGGAAALDRLVFSLRMRNLSRETVLLDGGRLLDGAWLLDQAVRGMGFPGLRFRLTVREPGRLSATLTRDSLWTLDGAHHLDGGRKLHAEIRKEEL